MQQIHQDHRCTAPAGLGRRNLRHVCIKLSTRVFFDVFDRPPAISVQGPVLKVVEGQEGAILYNDDESVCTASRQDSLNQCDLLTQPAFEAIEAE